MPGSTWDPTLIAFNRLRIIGDKGSTRTPLGRLFTGEGNLFVSIVSLAVPSLGRFGAILLLKGNPVASGFFEQCPNVFLAGIQPRLLGCI